MLYMLFHVTSLVSKSTQFENNFIYVVLNFMFEIFEDNNKHLSFLTTFDVFLFQQRDQILSLRPYLLFVW